jgi:hypothetical protein
MAKYFVEVIIRMQNPVRPLQTRAVARLPLVGKNKPAPLPWCRCSCHLGPTHICAILNNKRERHCHITSHLQYVTVRRVNFITHYAPFSALLSSCGIGQKS